MSDLKFKISNNFSKELKIEWDSLFKFQYSSVFQTYDWQYLWYENIQKKLGKSSLIIINVYFNNKIIGIIPFEKIKRFNINILSFIGNPFADYCDCLLDTNLIRSNNQLKIDIQNFILNLEDIDLIICDKIKETSHFHLLFDNIQFNKKEYNSYELIKNNNQNDLVPKKFISDTNRQIRRLQFIGKLSFKIANTFEEKIKIFEFFTNHKQKQLKISKSWNYLNNEVYRNFLNKLFVSNNSHLSYLTLNKKIIAVHLGYIIKKKFSYLFPTYDQEYSKFSPGNILLLNLIDSILKDNNGEVIDFTTGDEEYKLRLSNKKNVILYKNIHLSFKGYILKLCYEFLSKLKTIKLFKFFYQKIKY